MADRGNRDRFRGVERPPKMQDENRSESGKAPPSRHLWVGNLSYSVVEQDLRHHFLRFGEIEKIAFQSGRSYAFISFSSTDEAIEATKALQGFPLAGNPLRIEFTKADKSSAPPRDDTYLQHEDEHHFAFKGSPLLQRDSKERHASSDPVHHEKSNPNDKDAEPSEILWIGFPPSLKIDEMILRKTFSPFGVIEKITAFSGRSYAFVQFRKFISACRAKETLQGKLFGNPRVKICFAKREMASSNSRRSSANVTCSPSPHFRSSDHAQFSDNLMQENSLGHLTRDPKIRSPQFHSNLDSGDSSCYHYNRRGASSTGGNNGFAERWLGGKGSEVSRSPEGFEHYSSSPRQRNVHFPDIPKKVPLQGTFFEEQWDQPEPEDAYILHEAKKLKTESFPLDKDLPEFPLSDLTQQRHTFSRVFSDVPQPEVFDNNFDAGAFHTKKIPDNLMNSSLANIERSGHLKASFDSFHMGSDSLPSNSLERKRLAPELDHSFLKEWKWEGTIAKSGTPICRARCFPVGKVLDMILPEFLNCTARTSLDMLARHYYQAACTWAVFFVPESDNDMEYYNEFMHYLEEKQRAAVAKLDESTTLFLVPPSDFSEKVLKVPGKLSISGVILKLEQSAPNTGFIHHAKENKGTNLLSFPVDASYPRPSIHSGPIPPLTSFPSRDVSGANHQSFLGGETSMASAASISGSVHGMGGTSDSRNSNRYEHPLHQNPTAGSNWSSNHMENSFSGPRNVTSRASNGSVEPKIQEHHSVVPRAVQFANSSQTHSTGRISGVQESGSSELYAQGTKPAVSLSMPLAVQQEQLAQLASSLLVQQSQVGITPNIFASEGFGQTNTMNQSDYRYNTAQRHVTESNQVTTDLSKSYFVQGQLKQQPQQPSNEPQVPRTVQIDPQAREAAEEDPQKRLQATLQLAAALLQQIQQGKGT